eukprot:1865333-Prymnesium_polylepis.1
MAEEACVDSAELWREGAPNRAMCLCRGHRVGRIFETQCLYTLHLIFGGSIVAQDHFDSKRCYTSIKYASRLKAKHSSASMPKEAVGDGRGTDRRIVRNVLIEANHDGTDENTSEEKLHKVLCGANFVPNCALFAAQLRISQNMPGSIPHKSGRACAYTGGDLPAQRDT